MTTGVPIAEPGTNLSSLLFEHPFSEDQGLLFSETRTVTAGEARRQALALAGRLARLGVGRGHGVAVDLPNSPDSVIAMAAVWRAGAVVVPLNHRAPPPEKEAMILATGPMARIGEEGPGLLPPPPSATEVSRVYDPRTAFVLWTSGTTGRPKPILHGHDGYLELLDRVLGAIRRGSGRDGGTPSRRSGDPMPNLIPVSLSLNAGLYNALFGLRAGSALVIMDRFDPESFARLVQRFSIRSTVLPPAAMVELNDSPSIQDLGPLRYVRSITAPLSPLQARRFMDRFGVQVLNSYGQAEIGEVIGWTAADARSHPEKLGAAGRALPGVEVKVTDPERGPLGPDEVGDLLVRPPTVAAGEAGMGERAGRMDPEGFLRTGDLARVDGDGFVWIEGRSGEVINRGGNKVFPDQVEEVLRLSRHVVEASVVGIPDDRLGEVPVAFVVPRGALDPQELAELCRRHLSAYKVPVDFVAVEQLPRSDIGKVLRRELVAGYLGPSGVTRAGRTTGPREARAR